MRTLEHTSIATDGDPVERADRRQRRRRTTMAIAVRRHTNILALAAALLLALAALAAIAAHRLHALNWVCGFGETWDTVPDEI